MHYLFKTAHGTAVGTPWLDTYLPLPTLIIDGILSIVIVITTVDMLPMPIANAIAPVICPRERERERRDD